MRLKLILETDDFFEKTILDCNERQILSHDMTLKSIGGYPGFYLEDLLKAASKIKIELRDDNGNRII